MCRRRRNFHFGHGLSYSRFACSDLRCEPTRVSAEDTIEVSLAVHNESPTAGEATLFLFARDPVASVARPLLGLKGVQKAVLAAGERTNVKWRLPVKDLSFVGPNFDPCLSRVGSRSMSAKAPIQRPLSCVVELSK